MKAERVSYDIITPSAARGVIEAVHWKPAIRWFIDEIAVLNPIRFSSVRRNEVKSIASEKVALKSMKSGDLRPLQAVAEDDRTQRSSLILSDVDYIVTAHFEMTSKAGPQDNPAKHSDIFRRRMEKGQHFHMPCLGTREFSAEVEMIGSDEEIPACHESLAGERDLGFMLFDIDFVRKTPLFYRAIMRNGVVKVPSPASHEVFG